MNSVSRLMIFRSAVGLATIALFFEPAIATAQTWLANRRGPSLSEILVIDATGEPNWLWGFEDVAGNGAAFPADEQAIDARTAYVATDANRFYSRVYFSVPAAQPGNVTTYVFVDVDRDSNTGGRASSAVLDPAFTSDPTNGGYEYVIKVQRTGNDAATGSVFQFDNLIQQFVELTPAAGNIATETGNFDDPLRINQLNHGYLQSSVALALVGLTQACDANIFVRTTNQTTALGVGDSNVGEVAHSCVPQVDNNNVPVVVNPPPNVQCVSNAECANGGLCVNGACVFTQPCVVDANCPTPQACLDGRCVVIVGTACVDSSTCNGLLCQGGRCVVCTNDAACGTGFVCGADGRCVAGNAPIPCTNASTCNGLLCINGRCTQCTPNVPCGAGFVCDSNGRCLTTTTTTTTTPSDAGMIWVAPGEKLQGGACACRAAPGSERRRAGLLGLLGLAALLGRKLKRERRG